jgi:GDP-mannose 6-dehydrogenase
LRVSIFGLGCVGTVCAGCLAQEGHQIIGADPVSTKVDLINAGKSTIIEAEISEIIAEAVESGRLRATDNTDEAMANSELSFVCVGTPSQIDGNPDLTHVRHVCEQIGRALGTKWERHTVVIRSTVLPGTMRKIIV